MAKAKDTTAYATVSRLCDRTQYHDSRDTVCGPDIRCIYVLCQHETQPIGRAGVASLSPYGTPFTPHPTPHDPHPTP
eukprot:1064085-Rhodomonas_salina.2